MRATAIALTLGVIGLLATVAACGENSGRPAPESASPEGVTWVLRTMYGEPVVDGTFVWLWLEGDAYEGVDGCNNYGGVHQHGAPVVGDEGEFDPASMSVTAMLCKSPAGVMEQADEYLRLLGRQGQTLRVEGDRLEILDWSGETGLVFVRQAPLPGHPVELAGTAWELAPDDSASDDARAATMVFLDEHHAVGITACRGYVASYRVSGERLNVHWESGMTESGMVGMRAPSSLKAGGTVYRRTCRGSRVLRQRRGRDEAAQDSDKPREDCDIRAAGRRDGGTVWPRVAPDSHLGSRPIRPGQELGAAHRQVISRNGGDGAVPSRRGHVRIQRVQLLTA